MRFKTPASPALPGPVLLQESSPMVPPSKPDHHRLSSSLVRFSYVSGGSRGGPHNADPIDHQSYPVIYGSALNFTLPTEAEGVSLEADVAGKTVIFPLGPDLFLTWASCGATVNQDETSLYRCALKPGYRFQ